MALFLCHSETKIGLFPFVAAKVNQKPKTTKEKREKLSKFFKMKLF
jgi:hypothetical protein